MGRAAETVETVEKAVLGAKPTSAQLGWLRRGLRQPGGKLPLFDEQGQRMNLRTIRACLEQGWAEPWFDNPVKPDWLVCKLTQSGRRLVEAVPG
ncbi:MAG: hypothetical protein HYR63_26265 [Proteobacteria bacterium]|nr:hypothetical protein [Pseudomonadota bacterium]MBI3496038.1 hypothetical protein [Pseudomonadota bacterium]